MPTRIEAEALRRARDWPAVYDAYRDLEERTASVVEHQAEAAWWLGRMDESIRLYQDAYRGYLESGERQHAARTAVHLSIHTRLVGEAAQSAGWVGTAHRLLAEEPEGPCHGYAMYLDTAGLTGTDLDAAWESARRMQEIGGTHGDPTLVALGVYFEGRVRIKQARVAEGLALLDEAMVAALSDGPGPLWTGAIYCGLMDACNELRDLRRASEWTEATRRWSHPLPLASVYPGICRVHRAQVLQSRGDWDKAEEEALGACVDMVGIDVFAVADAYYEVGEVRRMRGDHAGAEQAYHQAHDYGRDPQPGMALLRLAQGRVDDASSSIKISLTPGNGSRLDQAPRHVAQVDIALAADDLDLAEASAAEVLEVAEMFDSDGLRAEGHRCHGALLLARGRAVEALAPLRMAFNEWKQLEVPYETGRTRLHLAEAYRALGDNDAAEREAAAAQACFDALGVVAPTCDDAAPAGLTAREVEVIRLLAGGMSNKEIAEALFLSPKTVARHLSNIFVKTGSATRSAATAFAYDHGLVGRSTHS
ncbi:LuxR C-terminal-related transcriptional regulator [Marmoricola sp. OAE513]|uniref:LuxR C-terminal-related transcriptional regulator n=1 Tax=Marmoricola sp. OAE513 TaxID=2817894 RepID=UPI001AE8CE44